MQAWQSERHSERERVQCATLPVGHQWEQRSRNASQPGEDQKRARQRRHQRIDDQLNSRRFPIVNPEPLPPLF